MHVSLRPASLDEADAISALALRSKGRAELTWTPGDRGELDADPCAAPLYERYGARRVAEVPSGSIPGRLLPRLVIEL